MNRLRDLETRTSGTSCGPQDVLDCISTLLRGCWTETGFGSITIESERIRPEIIRVIVHGTVSHLFHVRG